MHSDIEVGNALSCLKSQQLTQKCRCTEEGLVCRGGREVMCDAVWKRTKLTHFLPPSRTLWWYSHLYNEQRQFKVAP